MTAIPTRSSANVILVAIDSSTPSEAATAVAAKLASAVSAPDVHLMYVIQPMAGQDELVTTHAIDMTELIEVATVFLDGERGKLRQHYSGRIGIHVGMGEAADEVVAMARKLGAEYVVVGSHGRTGIRRLLLGSVAERIVRTAACTVVVARQPEVSTIPSIESGSAVAAAPRGAR